MMVGMGSDSSQVGQERFEWRYTFKVGLLSTQEPSEFEFLENYQVGISSRYFSPFVSFIYSSQS